MDGWSNRSVHGRNVGACQLASALVRSRPNADHPRVRGEQLTAAASNSSMAGSPPRARGTAHQPGADRAGGGITPACAGNRGGDERGHGVPPDHPRVRGEQAIAEAEEWATHGSPPRARGTEAGPVDHAPHLRITPACAGNRRGCRNSGTWGRDHPRVRGEQQDDLDVTVIDEGSPPACAGNSRRQPTTRAGRRDHPRVRGEQEWHLAVLGPGGGSPPHARGTGAVPRRRRDWSGITPACAGNRSHPGAVAGPRVGITPACAGNSLRPRAGTRRATDHPRVRGEQLTSNGPGQGASGSPPRARGTAHGGHRADPRDRITPACAGNRLPDLHR